MSEQEEHLAATESAGIPRKRDGANDSDSSEVNLLKRQIRYANQNIEFLQGNHYFFPKVTGSTKQCCN